MIAGVSFDLVAGQFTATDAAAICGVKRPVIDTMLTRGNIIPARRGHLSFYNVLNIALARAFAPFGIGLDESAKRTQPQKMEFAPSKKTKEAMARLAEISDNPGWTWAMARSIERNAPFVIYAYAGQVKGKWQFDLHIESAGMEKPTEEPCFGWHIPHVYVPVGDVFIKVYNDCKKLLGLTEGKR